MLVDHLAELVLAAGALGMAAFGIVEGLKRSHRIGEAGFEALIALIGLAPFEALKTAYGRNVEAFRADRAGLALGMHGPKPSGANAIPREVYHEQIPDGRASGHGDYFPGDPINQNQTSAVAFTRDVLQGVAQPHYV